MSGQDQDLDEYRYRYIQKVEFFNIYLASEAVGNKLHGAPGCLKQDFESYPSGLSQLSPNVNPYTLKIINLLYCTGSRINQSCLRHVNILLICCCWENKQSFFQKLYSSDLISVAVADSSPGAPPPGSSSIRPDPISAMSSAVSSRSRLTSGAMTPPAPPLFACCQGWKKPRFFFKNLAQCFFWGFLGFFVFFLGFLFFFGFFYIFAQKREFLWFFQFQAFRCIQT